MPAQILYITPQTPAIEQCCLTKLDKRFVIGAQLMLGVLSFNLMGAFHEAFMVLVLGTFLLLGFMIKEHVWAYALTKLCAVLFLAIYSLDIISLIPLISLPALSNETMTLSLGLREGLGIWVAAILVTNLWPVPLHKIIHS